MVNIMPKVSLEDSCSSPFPHSSAQEEQGDLVCHTIPLTPNSSDIIRAGASGEGHSQQGSEAFLGGGWEESTSAFDGGATGGGSSEDPGISSSRATAAHEPARGIAPTSGESAFSTSEVYSSAKLQDGMATFSCSEIFGHPPWPCKSPSHTDINPFLRSSVKHYGVRQTVCGAYIPRPSQRKTQTYMPISNLEAG
jgi:hypothetical protein